MPQDTVKPQDAAMPQDTAEKILVVPTARFREIGYFQGFCREPERYVRELFDADDLSFRPRDEMEQDPGFKQLIPYVIFRHTDSEGTARLFQYTRGTGQGEGRLHRKRSVGIGGHISDLDARDASGGDVYVMGMRRELAEEVFVEAPYSDMCVGLINDDETPVGQVHLGVVHLLDIERPTVRPREDELLDAGFVPVQEILRDLEQFETWSQIAVRALFG